MDLTRFQERLRELMDSNGLNMRTLAAKADTTPSTVSRYLSSNRSPELTYIVKLAEFFGVSVDWLLGLDDDRYAPLPKEQKELLDLYSIATPDDRRVIQAVLSKYRKEE